MNINNNNFGDRRHHRGRFRDPYDVHDNEEEAGGEEVENGGAVDAIYAVQRAVIPVDDDTSVPFDELEQDQHEKWVASHQFVSSSSSDEEEAGEEAEAEAEADVEEEDDHYAPRQHANHDGDGDDALESRDSFPTIENDPFESDGDADDADAVDEEEQKDEEEPAHENHIASSRVLSPDRHPASNTQESPLQRLASGLSRRVQNVLTSPFSPHRRINRIGRNEGHDLIPADAKKLIAAFYHERKLVCIRNIRLDNKNSKTNDTPREGLNAALARTGIAFNSLLRLEDDNVRPTKHGDSFVLNLFEIEHGKAIPLDVWELLWGAIPNSTAIKEELKICMKHCRSKMKDNDVPDGTDYPPPCIMTEIRGTKEAWKVYARRPDTTETSAKHIQKFEKKWLPKQRKVGSRYHDEIMKMEGQLKRKHFSDSGRARLIIDSAIVPYLSSITNSD